MGKISEFTAQDHEVIARDYADLKEAARKRCNNSKELDIIQKAFEFANEAHKGVRRRSGEPYILHPIAVAKIVVSNRDSVTPATPPYAPCDWCRRMPMTPLRN